MDRNAVYYTIVKNIKETLEENGYYVMELEPKDIPVEMTAMSERNPIYTNLLKGFFSQRASLDYLTEKEKRKILEMCKDYMKNGKYAKHFTDEREFDYFRHAKEEEIANFYTDDLDIKRYEIVRVRGKGYQVEIQYNRAKEQEKIKQLVKDYVATKIESGVEEDEEVNTIDHYLRNKPAEPNLPSLATINPLEEVRKQYVLDQADVRRLQRLNYIMKIYETQKYLKSLGIEVIQDNQYHHLVFKRNKKMVAVHPHYIVALDERPNAPIYKRTKRDTTSADFHREGKSVFQILLKESEKDQEALTKLAKLIYISYTLSATRLFRDMK